MWRISTASVRSRCRPLVGRMGFSASSITVDNPYTLKEVCTLKQATKPDMLKIIDDSDKAFQSWKASSLEQRIECCKEFLEAFEQRRDVFAAQITEQMGKPYQQSINEVNGTIFRAQTMMNLAPKALEDKILSTVDGVDRRISREPIGVVLALCPWNYPLMCAVNTVVPAILAGNSVIIKHSDRTPLAADAFSETFKAIGAPHGLVSSLHASHELVSDAISHPAISFVAFTGSVSGGSKVYRTVSKRFIDTSLELGGKDAAYVAADADIKFAAEGIVDGAFYNAGQSCCSVERALVHESVYDEFMSHALKLVNAYKMGDPMAKETTLGPMAQPSATEVILNQLEYSIGLGANLLSGGEAASDSAGKGRFMLPTLLTNCTTEMPVMVEETFGPVLPVMKVTSDDSAIQVINDSAFGLTGSVWTSDNDRADRLCKEIDCGTVFQNRCDYLDPELVWSGRRDSGKGTSLSELGFHPLTKTKSYNLRRS